MVNYTYAGGYTVPGIVFNGTIEPAYYLPNGTLWLAGFYPNGSMIMPEDCTFETCNLEMGNQLYRPDLGENIGLAAIFGFLLLAQIPLAVIYRTWGFSAGVIIGLVLEIVGYVGRIMMHDDLFSQGPFIIYIVCLTIAPAFICAAIYLCLARIITVYGLHIARFRPLVYTIVFMVADFISLVLQGTGGGMASTADTHADSQTGINTMIAGLIVQVVSLTIYIALCSDFALRAYRRQGTYSPEFSKLRDSLKFKLFLGALATATVTVFVRSIYRVIELWAGFDSAFANDETLFLVLEGIMLVVACTAITVFQPGLVYGRQTWAAANFRMRSKAGDAALGHATRAEKAGFSSSSSELRATERV